MAKQAREVGLVYDLPHLLQGEQWGPVSCAKASQEEVAEDLYSVCVCVVCVCGCIYQQISRRGFPAQSPVCSSHYTKTNYKYIR